MKHAARLPPQRQERCRRRYLAFLMRQYTAPVQPSRLHAEVLTGRQEKGLAPGQQGSFCFGIAKKVRLEENPFYGEIQPLTDKGQSKVRDNLFQRESPDKVSLRETAKDLETFRAFHEKKGNPHEKHGLTINWIES